MKNIFLLTIGMFALGLDAYVISGLLPYISNDLNISIASAAQGVTAFTLCYALSAPIFVTLLSGKKIKNILILALILFIIGNAVSAVSTTLSIFILSRCIAGIGAGIYSPLAIAGAVSLVSPERRGTALSLALGGMSTGVVLGVPLGLVIAAHIGWHNTLWLITFFGVLGASMLFMKFPNIKATPPPTLMARISILKNKSIVAVVMVSFLMAVASLGLYTYVSLIVSSMYGKYNLASYFWFWGIGGLIGSFGIGKIIDKTEAPRVIMIFILALLAISILAIPFAMQISIISMLPFMIWGAMGWASQTPQEHTLIHLEPQHAATAIALNSSINYLGGSVGAMLGGVLLSMHVTPITLTNLAGAVCIIALVGQIYIVYKNKRGTK